MKKATPLRRLQNESTTSNYLAWKSVWKGEGGEGTACVTLRLRPVLGFVKGVQWKGVLHQRCKYQLRESWVPRNKVNLTLVHTIPSLYYNHWLTTLYCFILLLRACNACLLPITQLLLVVVVAVAVVMLLMLLQLLLLLLLLLQLLILMLPVTSILAYGPAPGSNFLTAAITRFQLYDCVSTMILQGHSSTKACSARQGANQSTLQWNRAVDCTNLCLSPSVPS